MALPLPDEYPIYVAYPPIDAEYPCITYNHDSSDNKFVGLARGTQVYKFTAWASTRDECNRVSLALERIVGYSDENIKTIYLENGEAGFENGMFYKTSYVRVVLVGSYRR